MPVIDNTSTVQQVIYGDNLKVLPTLSTQYDAVITDPPYGLSFMGKDWDHGIPGIRYWQEIMRVMKPGSYMVCFGGTRTYHRLACAVEDTGFVIRDCLMWLYGQGFPKSKSCLKPAWEPILLAMKPGKGVKEFNVDDCRIPLVNGRWTTTIPQSIYGNGKGIPRGEVKSSPLGRYPANVIHDGSEEVIEAFAEFGEKGGGLGKENRAESKGRYGNFSGATKGKIVGFGDNGNASRFFYCAKASKRERGEGNKHPTVKPLALIRWLVRLISKPGDTILDPFLGSGTTLLACREESRNGVGIEKELEYVNIAKGRLGQALPLQVKEVEEKQQASPPQMTLWDCE